MITPSGHDVQVRLLDMIYRDATIIVMIVYRDKKLLQ